ncbi:MAG: helix-turn-helix transcriptional regulator [Bacteroidia bacterium]|nr:helix-turn-helix transcriptional regulator [Bacteroidia bacterium]
MKGTYLGELEEIVLLAVAALYDEAYGVSVKQELETRMGRGISVGALHTAFKRLEDKGFLQSRLGEATAERGGKRKRFFRVTVYGHRALTEARDLRSKLWDAVPPVAFDFS